MLSERFTVDGDRLLRTVMLNGERIGGAYTQWDGDDSLHRSWWRSWYKGWPEFDGPTKGKLKIADIFSGAGGFSLGAELAARTFGHDVEHIWAVEWDEEIAGMYERNIRPKVMLVTDAATVDYSTLEQPDILIGGPPCQGFSQMNIHTKGKDQRNQLMVVAARAAVATRAKMVILENVIGAQDGIDKTSSVAQAKRILMNAGYKVFSSVLNAADIGWAQKRTRRFLIGASHTIVPPEAMARLLHREHLTVGDVIDGCTQEGIMGRSREANERALWKLSQPKHDDVWLFCVYLNGKSFALTRYYREPSTFLIPELMRSLSPHEAARLQGFPDWFDFGSKLSKIDYAIGNAVPVPLAEAVVLGALTPLV